MLVQKQKHEFQGHNQRIVTAAWMKQINTPRDHMAQFYNACHIFVISYLSSTEFSIDTWQIVRCGFIWVTYFLNKKFCYFAYHQMVSVVSKFSTLWGWNNLAMHWSIDNTFKPDGLSLPFLILAPYHLFKWLKRYWVPFFIQRYGWMYLIHKVSIQK